MPLKRIIILLWISCVLSHATEVAAWRIPLQKLLPMELKTEGVNRCEPPEASAFFNANDVLWDLSNVMGQTEMATNPKADWAIWNETTERLITKSSETAFQQLYFHYHCYHLPIQIRLTTEVFPVTNMHGKPQRSQKPLLKSSATCTSTESVQITWGNQCSKAEFKIQAVAFESKQTVEVSIEGTVHPQDQASLSIQADLTLNNGKSRCVARDYDGNSGLDIILTGQVELIDGTPIEEAVLVQRGAITDPYYKDFEKSNRIRIGNQWLLTTPFPPDYFHSSETNSAPRPNKQVREQKKIAAPKTITEWFPNPVIDLRDDFKKSGIDMGEVGFVAYDPRSHLGIAISDNQEDLDKVEMLLTPLVWYRSQVEVTWDEVGESKLVGFAGMKSTLLRWRNDGSTKRCFEIEPNTGGELIDLRYYFESNANPDHHIKMTGAFSLEEGQWHEAGITKNATGNKTIHRAKAEVIPYE